MADPPVFILDEPTSQIDPISEDRFRTMLDEQRGSRTVLVVAHRLASNSLSDRQAHSGEPR